VVFCLDTFRISPRAHVSDQYRDAFLTNVIDPVCTVLENFIDPAFRKRLRIEVQSQAAYSFDKDDVENYIGSTSRYFHDVGLSKLTFPIPESFLDHSIALVERGVDGTSFRKALVVIEYKVRLYLKERSRHIE
jgi:hypothetical protein